MERTIRVERVGFPASESVTVGTGRDLATAELIRFVVPPESVLLVLASLHAGENPVIHVHEFDIVDWTMWWEEV
jgi:hypothetical protein